MRMSTKMREPEAMKLFIGQVPRDWGEKDLRELFTPYGDIHSLNLLMDKSTGQHKGCAFITYYENSSAKSAQEDLHEKKTLPGARNPIQVKPASSETDADNRKLFVGMISKSLTEEGVRNMFSSFGTIEDVTVLRGPDGQSKGCAFIKYESRLQAQNAIRSMHNSQTMEGCRAPIVVKIADSEKDKMKKKQLTSGAVGVPTNNMSTLGLPLAAGAANVNPLLQQQLLAQMALPSLIASNPSLQGVPGTMGAIVAAMAQQQQQLQQQLSQQTSQANISGISANAMLGLGAVAPTSNNALLGVGGAYGNNYATTGSHTLADNTMQQAYTGMQQYMATALPQAYATIQQPAAQLQQVKVEGNAVKKEGPEGANLFIYQVPTEFNDNDLMQTFMPFGNVISANVFIDKKTGMSKGFGFVSYDNASSAANAIASMNGFAIGSKRLKVQLKRSKDKPY